MWGNTLFCICPGALVVVLARLAPTVHIRILQYKFAECTVLVLQLDQSVPSDTLVIGPALALAGSANILFQLTACFYFAE